MTHHFLAALLALAVASGAAAATPLIDAVKVGNGEAVAELLRRGTDVNGAEPDGTTPLMWAAYGGDAELVAALLEAGADAKATNEYGATAMAEAAIAGDAAIIELLLEAGVDANSANPEGETALLSVARTATLPRRSCCSTPAPTSMRRRPGAGNRLSCGLPRSCSPR